MLTERKMFSSSFESSAASSVESDDDLVADRLVELAGALGAGRGEAAEQLRRGARSCSRCGRGRSAPARRRGGSRCRPRGPSAPAPAAAPRGWCRGSWSTRARPAAPPQDPGERLAGRRQVTEVGLARAGQRRRHADHDRLAGRRGPRRGRWRAGARESGSSTESGTSSMWLRPAFSASTRRDRCRGRRPRAPPRQRLRRAAGRRSRARRSRSSSAAV